MMSRSTTPEQRGAASGVYSLMQFLGIFTGGVVGGWPGLDWRAGGLFTSSLPSVLLWPCRAPLRPAPWAS